MLQVEGVDQDEECARALFGHRRECAVEVVVTSGLQELKLHPQRLGRDLQFSYRRAVITGLVYEFRGEASLSRLSQG